MLTNDLSPELIRLCRGTGLNLSGGGVEKTIGEFDELPAIIESFPRCQRGKVCTRDAGRDGELLRNEPGLCRKPVRFGDSPRFAELAPEDDFLLDTVNCLAARPCVRAEPFRVKDKRWVWVQARLCYASRGDIES